VDVLVLGKGEIVARRVLGVWSRKSIWGCGYSGECARTLAALTLDVRDLELVCVTQDPDNEKSCRAIEKYVESLGGRREGVVRNGVVIGADPWDTVRYSVTCEEWQEATGGGYDAEFEW
jgi:RimJ/RimL family protein N-acetyltransferase